MHTKLFIALTITSSLALANAKKPVTATTSSPATLVTSDTDNAIGCGFYQLPLSNGGGTVEGFATFNRASLEKRAKNFEVKGVWTWCVKPDLSLRVWSACTGSGDSTQCKVLIAPVVKGVIGKSWMLEAGWAAPTVEAIDGANAPWKGRGLKIRFEAGRGNAVVGAHLDFSKDYSTFDVKFTTAEWDDN